MRWSLCHAIRSDGKETVVCPPHHEEENETDEEGWKAHYKIVQLGVSLWDFERNDDEGEGKADDVRESIDAGHVRAAKTKSVARKIIVDSLHFVPAIRQRGGHERAA